MGEAVRTVVADAPDALTAVAVDADAETDLARRYGIMSLPTLLVFRDGRLVDRLVGARGPARLRQDLAAHL